MPLEFKLPDVGEGLAEGELVTWLVAEGDTVTEDQPIAEVETDKALVELPSPVTGTVNELLVEEGEMVPVGTVVVVFDVEGEDSSEETTENESPSRDSDGETIEARGSGDHGVFAPPHVRRVAREVGVNLETVSGSGPSGRITERDVREAVGSDPGSGSEASTDPEKSGARDSRGTYSSADESTEDQVVGDSGVRSAESRDRTLAAPATRRVARELGVDVNTVPAVENRDGEAFVTREAVRAYADAQRAAQEADAVEGPEEVMGGGDERVGYRGWRRTIGQQMERSKYTAPHVTHFDLADVDGLVEARSDLKGRAEERGIKLTYLPFVMKAVAVALQEFPFVNAVLDEENEEIILKRSYHLGFAVATDEGLLVPVVNDVDQKGLLQLASEVNELADKARDREIAREEMMGGTFTITNVGALGGEYATPIINYPEVAILALGSIKQRPRVVDGDVMARYTLPLSLSFDHRVLDGAVAVKFTNQVIELLKNPVLLLIE